MKRIFSVIVVLICLPLIGFGQTDNYTKSVNAAELCDVVKGNSFSTYQNADLALDKILSVTGMSKRFVLKECNGISNCIATEFNGIRYILYDKYFMDDIAENNSSWTNISILAHEIGHHVNGHSLDLIVAAVGTANAPSLSESRQRELEADEFSGFVLQKLGASLYQAQEAIRILSSNADDSYSTHPSRDKRLAAVEKGYNKSKGVNANNDSQNSNSSLTAEDYFYKAYNSSDYNYQIKCYSTAIEIKPTYANAFMERGVLYYNLKNYHAAISDFGRAMRLDRDLVPECFYLQGIAELNAQNLGGALGSFAAALELNPNNNRNYENSSIHYSMGCIYQQLLVHSNAIESFDNAIKLEPEFAKAYLSRGNSFISKELYGSAVRDFSTAISLNLNYLDNVWAYLSRGYAYNLLKNYRSAFSDYNSVIRLDPDNAKAYFMRASLGFRKQLSNRSSNCSDYKKACDLGLEDGCEWYYKQCR